MQHIICVYDNGCVEVALLVALPLAAPGLVSIKWFECLIELLT